PPLTLSLHDALPICARSTDAALAAAATWYPSPQPTSRKLVGARSEISCSKVGWVKLRNAVSPRSEQKDVPRDIGTRWVISIFSIDRKSTRLNSSHVK